MKTSIAILLLAFAATFLVSACASESLGPGDLQSIMPLKVGNMWIGRAQEFDADGTLISTMYDTLTITGTEVFKDETWYTTDHYGYYISRNGGLWQRNLFDSVLIAKHPAAVGEIFSRDSAFSPGFEVYFRVDALGEQVTVPAGTFTATNYATDHINHEGTPFRLGIVERWYAPGVGPIKTVNYSLNNVIIRQWELMEVVLK